MEVDAAKDESLTFLPYTHHVAVATRRSHGLSGHCRRGLDVNDPPDDSRVDPHDTGKEKDREQARVRESGGG